MRKTMTVAVVCGLAASAVLVMGCAASHLSPATDGWPRSRKVMLEFPRNTEASTARSTDPGGSPQALVEFALVLSEDGRHTRAAEFLVEASRTPAPDNEFRIACLSAAANEYLLGGELEQWGRTMESLRERMDRFQLASVGGLTEIHMVLKDVADGEGITDPTALPPQLRTLLRRGR